MFAAYSRHVDRRIFTSINSRFTALNHKNDSPALEKFTTSIANQDIGDFYLPPQYPGVSISKTAEYPLVYKLQLPSPVLSGYAENDVVHGDCYPRHSLSAPAVILVSGWLMDNGDRSRLADQVARCGRNLWTIDIPYHGRRTPQGTTSGELFVSSDIVRCLNAVRQLVAEVRVLAAALRKLGVTDIALLGFSLGGWAGALLSVVEDAFSRILLVTPVVRPDELLLSSPYFSFARKGFNEKHETEILDKLERLYLPRALAPAVSPDSIHLIGAHEDPLAPPRDIAELSAAWGCTKTILPGGHVTVYITPRLWRNVINALDVSNGAPKT
jgi:pimeloyl-ACP methyl ester carboxylesterase